MFCTNCGKQLPDNVTFCSGYGKPVSVVKPVADPSPRFTATDKDGTVHTITLFELQEGVTEAFGLSAEFYNKEITGQTDDLDEVFEKMKPVFEKLQPFTVAWPDKDYLQAFGTMAHLMAKYRCEYSYDPEDGEKYADAGYEVLKRFKQAYENELDEKAKLRTHIAVSLAGEYCAYIAYLQNYLDYAVNVLKELPTTPITLALTGSCLCLIANSRNDYNLVRVSMGIFDEMDKQITQAPKAKMDQDIYRIAYGWYGLMLAKNPDTYPEGGFERDLPKAIYAVKRGIMLMTDREFIDMLQPDLDEYTAMF